MDLRVALIGVWDSLSLRILDALATREGVEVDTIIDKDRVRATEIAKRYGAKYCEESIRLGDEIDGALVGLEFGERFASLEELLDGGKKVLATNPVADTERGIETILSKEQASNLFIALPSRHIPLLVRARSISRSGFLGELRSVHLKFLCQRSDEERQAWQGPASKAVLLDAGLAAADFLNWLVGKKPRRVYASEAGSSGHPACAVTVSYDSDVIASSVVGWVPTSRDLNEFDVSLEVVGSKRVLVFNSKMQSMNATFYEEGTAQIPWGMSMETMAARHFKDFLTTGSSKIPASKVGEAYRLIFHAQSSCMNRNPESL